LYVSTSNGGPRAKSDYNHVAAYAIAGDGALSPHGEPRPLSRRAVHMCVDPAGRYALNAHNYPSSGITVHSIARDGRIADGVDQRFALDFGIYPHQVMMFPSGRTALIADRGNNAQGDKPEDPGALRSFGFEGGALRAGQVMAPNGGHGFGPRHVAFHPSKPWIYVSDERKNRLYVVASPTTAWTMSPPSRETLADRRTWAATCRSDPSSERAVGLRGQPRRFQRRLSRTKVSAGGENNIAVYSLDQEQARRSSSTPRRTPSMFVHLLASRAGVSW
jgi:hypothetical protein